MSSFHVYSLDGFSMYLMPRAAAPEFPPCQSGTLPSVFEDDDDCEIGKLSKVNKALKKILARSKRPSVPKFLSSTRLRSSLTLSPRNSGSATDSLNSKNSL
ncbi:hypothetical protein PCANC_23474 [Puccinia coronata f. sp. avenae]|uniref:Uncharacterized protein n=1 Tax=Puccinia coronata f. sp. avenae TaxID=200324 RepID=A0A2N5RZC2_9BASI|nr:hypothetical protein PCANC_26378 [Puccinia coronata f. sp. avenae]PLW29101.1 hypothetical protein PCANC_23474 [Puccinia coronata f. sp. avenae]